MGYRELVKKLISEADIVLEIIDARFPMQSRNEDVENLCEALGKKLLVVVNKSDLVSKREAERIKIGIKKNCVFISAKKRLGSARLRIEIGKLGAGAKVKAAIVGYPNTGKSTVINMLKGRHAALTSSTPGFTKGKQFVRVSANLLLIDTPGVISVADDNEMLLALLSAKNAAQLQDLEGTGLDIAELLIKNQCDEINAFYGIDAKTGEEFLEKLAQKRGRLKRGGISDIHAAARILIDDFQAGKISLKGGEKAGFEEKSG